MERGEDGRKRGRKRGRKKELWIKCFDLLGINGNSLILRTADVLSYDLYNYNTIFCMINVEYSLYEDL